MRATRVQLVRNVSSSSFTVCVIYIRHGGIGEFFQGIFVGWREDPEFLAAERFFERFWRQGRVISHQPMNQIPSQIPNMVTEVAPSAKDLMRFESEKKSAGVAL